MVQFRDTNINIFRIIYIIFSELRDQECGNIFETLKIVFKKEQ